jgi:hypothetical protein
LGGWESAEMVRRYAHLAALSRIYGAFTAQPKN